MSDYSKNMNLDETENSSFPKVNPAPKGSEAIMMADGMLFRTSPDNGEFVIVLTADTDEVTGVTVTSCNRTYEEIKEYAETVLNPITCILIRRLTHYGEVLSVTEIARTSIVFSNTTDTVRIVFPYSAYSISLSDLTRFASASVHLIEIHPDDVIIAIYDGSMGASLPLVGPDDNNKVAKVANGAWAVAAEELPPVTAADNGKILKVANGVWTAAIDE